MRIETKIMLWINSKTIASAARNSGSLHPIATDETVLKQDGVEFEVNVINKNIFKKISISKTQGNPFLPYDQDMYVKDLGENHVVLLNKFPVLSPHILLCSKDYIEQIAPLTLNDFEAWLACFETEDTLGFYNGGRGAGASQPHRHMQLIKKFAPIESLIFQQFLPFKNATGIFDKFSPDSCYDFYLSAMKQLNLYGEKECLPHNILLTNRWMMIVPRSKVKHLDIFLNGLNYAGFFLLKHQDQLADLSAFGCFNLLAECAE